ncbi:MAG TPA: hypothetical protein VES42_16530 [Pilimelia sp.]|nr:hypothetical protein [Pilimelia sp.]
MRKRAMTVLGLAVLGAAAGCTNGTATPSPSASATVTASAAAGGPVAACVTGSWRSTEATGRAAAVGANATLRGGAGIGLTVGPNGEVTLDFSGAQPVDFTAQVAGAEVTGRFTYSGRATGTVRTDGAATGTPSAPADPTAGPTADPTVVPPAGTASPVVTGTAAPTASAGGGATSGVWEPVPPVNWGDTRLTVELTKPATVRVLDNQPIGNYVGDGADRTGNVVDVDPFLGVGTYECRGDTLVLAPDDDNGIAWTLSRA